MTENMVFQAIIQSSLFESILLVISGVGFTHYSCYILGSYTAASSADTIHIYGHLEKQPNAGGEGSAFY